MRRVSVSPRARVNPCDKGGSNWTIFNKCRRKGEVQELKVNLMAKK